MTYNRGDILVFSDKDDNTIVATVSDIVSPNLSDPQGPLRKVGYKWIKPEEEIFLDHVRIWRKGD